VPGECRAKYGAFGEPNRLATPYPAANTTAAMNSLLDRFTSNLASNLALADLRCKWSAASY
jgi:hypothetical protein